MMKNNVPDSHATRNRIGAGRSPYSHAKVPPRDLAGVLPPTPLAARIAFAFFNGIHGRGQRQRRSAASASNDYLVAFVVYKYENGS